MNVELLLQIASVVVGTFVTLGGAALAYIKITLDKGLQALELKIQKDIQLAEQTILKSVDDKFFTRELALVKLSNLDDKLIKIENRLERQDNRLEKIEDIALQARKG